MANFWENDPISKQDGNFWANDPVVGSPKSEYEAAKKKAEGALTGSFKSSLERLKGESALLAGKIGLMDEKEAEQYRKQKEAEAAAIYTPTQKGWMEAPATHISELIGGSLPYMAAPVIGAGVGVGAAAVAPELAAGTIGATLLGVAPEIGAGAASLTQFTGSNLARQMDENKQSLADTSLLKAGASAVPQALLDVYGLKMLPAVRGIFGKAGVDISEEAAKQIATRGFLSEAGKIAKVTGKTMGAEGATEAGQQFLERLQAGLSISDADARNEYFQSFLGGAVLGGAFSVPGHITEQALAKPKIEAERKRQEEAKRELSRQAALEAQTMGQADVTGKNLQAQQAALAQQQIDLEGQQAVQTELERQRQEAAQQVSVAPVQAPTVSGETVAAPEVAAETPAIAPEIPESAPVVTPEVAEPEAAPEPLTQPEINRQRQAKKKAAKSDSLIAHLKRIGGINSDDKLDIAGDKKMIGGGYNTVFKKGATSLKARVEDGQLDEYLPYEMRKETHDLQSDQPYDGTEAYNYIADAIKRAEPLRPHAVEEEAARRSREEEDAAMQAEYEAQLRAEQEAIDKANAEMAMAGAEERQTAAEQKIYEPEEPALELTGQTNAEIEFDRKVEAAARAEEARKAAAPTPEDFTLTGSTRPADEAAARGAQDLFDRPFEARGKEPKESSSVAEIKQAFKGMFTGLGNQPVIVQSPADLPAPYDKYALKRKGVTAFVDPDTGQDYYIADRIQKGDERGRIMHEKGVHLGLRKLVGQDRMNMLVNKIYKWSTDEATNDQEKVAQKIAKEAMRRADRSKEKIGSERHQEEVIAYFTDIAVNKYGIDPFKAQPKENALVVKWLKDLWSRIETAMKKLNYNPKDFTAEDLVEVVYGAARVEGVGRVSEAAGKVDVMASEKVMAAENDELGKEEGLKDMHALAQDTYGEYDSPDEAYDAMYEAATPRQKSVLRALKKDQMLGFDYPHQAIEALLEEPEVFELYPSTKGALSKLGNQYWKDSRTKFMAAEGETATPSRNIANEPVEPTWLTPAETQTERQSMIDDLLYKMQDNQRDTKLVQQAILKAGRGLEDTADVYGKEKLYHGRTATKMRNFLLNDVNPIIKEMVRLKVTPEEINTYLHNKHAEAYNKQMNELNPGNERLQDQGSGIHTDAAKAYLASLDPTKKADLEAVADKFYKITKDTRKMLVDSGDITQQTSDMWERIYPYYVPLRRVSENDTNVSGLGRGFGTRGDFTKRAMGSLKAADDIIGNILAEHERAIVLGEKMKVGQALLELALKNPNPDFWLPVDPDAIKDPASTIAALRSMGMDDAEEIINNFMAEPKERYIKKTTQGGQQVEVVDTRVNAMKRFRDNVFPVRVNGKDMYIFFNQHDPNANRMVKSLKNLDPDNLDIVLSTFQKFTQWFKNVNTQYNPVFGFVNLFRDTSGAMLNLSTTPLANDKAKVFSGITPAMRGIIRVLRDERAGKTDTEGPWAELYKDAREHGFQSGHRESLIRRKEEMKIIEEKITQNKSAGFKKAFGYVVGQLSDFNDMMENAVRLSAYKAALDKGMSKHQAAILAKDLTVNFDKRGQTTPTLNALYAFFNASVQGTSRIVETMKGPAGRKIVVGGIGVGVLQSMMMAAAGFTDDDPPEFIREKNFIIPTGDGKYITIPYPLGFNVLPNVGRITTDVVMTGGDKLGKRSTDLLSSIVDAFNPLGSSGLSMQLIAPTILDIPAAIAENRDAFGRPIAREDRVTKPTPGIARSRESASGASKALAGFLNNISGGTPYQKGAISPTADTLDFIAGQLGGGIAREVMKVGEAGRMISSGEEIPSYKVPLASRFYGETGSAAAASNRFYENMAKLSGYGEEIKGRRQQHEDVREFLAEHPEARLSKASESVYNQVSNLNRQKKKLQERGADPERIKKIEERKVAIMRRFNDRVESFQKD